MRLKLVFACPLLLICSVPRLAQCQKIDGVYRGTLGKQAIVLEIGIDPQQQGGRYLVGEYFYRRYGVGISIKEMRMKDDSFLLEESGGNQTAPRQWKLKFDDNVASGSFCKCDLENALPGQAKLLPIYLERVSSDFDPNFDLVSPNAYSDSLLDFPLTTSPDVTKTGYAYAMMTDSRFKTSMPRITRFPDAPVMMKINMQLQKQLKEFRLEAANCLQHGRVNTIGDFDISTTVELFSRHLMSVVREGGLYCGGAYPGYYLSVNTFDLDSGTEPTVAYLLAREMDPDALKKLVKKDDEITSKSEISRIEATSRIAAELYLQHHTPYEKECGDVFNRDQSGAPDFTTIQYLSEKGLIIIPDLPHVVQVCADPLLIPYDELRPLLKPNSQFLDLVGAAH